MKKTVITLIFCCLTLTAFAQTNKDNKIILTIHANVDANTQAPSWLRHMKSTAKFFNIDGASQYAAEMESISAGHAWISVKSSAICKTYGLFGEGVTIDKEAKYKNNIHRSVEISEDQLLRLNLELQKRKNYQWTGYYNCANYASELWKEVTGEFINPVPIRTYYVDKTDGKYSVKTNVKLNPLPPSPLGIIQAINSIDVSTAVDKADEQVCP